MIVNKMLSKIEEPSGKWTENLSFPHAISPGSFPKGTPILSPIHMTKPRTEIPIPTQNSILPIIIPIF